MAKKTVEIFRRYSPIDLDGKQNKPQKSIGKYTRKSIGKSPINYKKK
jgi:hypothetical protein